MQNLEKVPCLNVTKENLTTIWPSLIEKINRSSFIGIDFEFSGIGDRIDYGIKDIEIRYELLAGIVKERSILSVGLSLFEYEEIKLSPNMKPLKRKKLEDGELENEIWKYKVNNYNLFCECDGEYVREEQALEFLKKHGFDFEVHSKNAIKYKKGNDDNESDEMSLRNLFVKIIQKKRPVVMHNGLLDLIYFYHHFYCELPEKMATFIIDLDELFKGGIYDTKFICELNTDLKISFLEYLFYYTQRMNILKIAYDDDHLIMSFDQLNELTDVNNEKLIYDYGNLKTLILKTKPEGLEICKNYRNYGWCKDKDDCLKSHNIDFILDSKFDNSKTKSRYNKDLRKMKELNESKENHENGVDEIIKFSEKGGVHSAGFDAFMTSFCFAYFVLEYYEDMPLKMDPTSLKRKLRFVTNRIYIPFTGKHTLHIKRSEFGCFSKNHRIKYEKIFGKDSPDERRPFNRQNGYHYQQNRNNHYQSPNNNNNFSNFSKLKDEPAEEKLEQNDKPIDEQNQVTEKDKPLQDEKSIDSEDNKVIDDEANKQEKSLEDEKVIEMEIQTDKSEEVKLPQDEKVIDKEDKTNEQQEEKSLEDEKVTEMEIQTDKPLQDEKSIDNEGDKVIDEETNKPLIDDGKVIEMKIENDKSEEVKLPQDEKVTEMEIQNDKPEEKVEEKLQQKDKAVDKEEQAVPQNGSEKEPLNI